MNEYEVLREKDGVGFAEVYLWRSNEESKSNDEIDKEVYSKLVELDTRLGTTASEQLFSCLHYSNRWDIIKVVHISFHERLIMFKIIDFDNVNEYETLRNNNWAGFAEVYLGRCDEQSKSNDGVDKEIYTKLVELDTRLGTTVTEQLFGCVALTRNLDVIKV